MRITKTEKASLKALLPLCRGLPKKWDDGTGIRQYDNDAGIIMSFFKSRRINVEFYEPCFASFQSIGMHVDGISPENHETLIVPILGKGNLNHFVNGRIETAYFYPLSSNYWKMIRLDDDKPHSFITAGTCHALLINIPKEALNLFDRVL